MTGSIVSFLEKISPWTGLVFAGVFVYGMMLIKPTDYFPSPERAAEIFTSNPAQIQRGALAGGFYSVFFLVWFISELFKRLTRAGNDASFAPAFMLAGGIILAVSVMVASGIFWVAAGRASREGGMSPESAVIYYDMIQLFLSNLISIGLAILIGGAGLGMLQYGLFPAWLGWISLVFTVGLLTPYHYVFEGIGVIWIALVSVLLNFQ